MENNYSEIIGWLISSGTIISVSIGIFKLGKVKKQIETMSDDIVLIKKSLNKITEDVQCIDRDLSRIEGAFGERGHWERRKINGN